MSYIDKTGKRMIDNKKWSLNEFTDSLAWAVIPCERLFVINKDFKEVRAISMGRTDFCTFKMLTGPAQNQVWGFDVCSSGRKKCSKFEKCTTIERR
ncbi:MAG: hypothetical protein LBC85_01180 [Fibromonadaceae bacterium]|jgi:hypothetical protein|nr:hypothetical protein [Fibromonadaceae bacterium]